MSRETNFAAVSVEACEINEDGEIKYFPAHRCDPEARIPEIDFTWWSYRFEKRWDSQPCEIYDPSSF